MNQRGNRWIVSLVFISTMCLLWGLYIRKDNLSGAFFSTPISIPDSVLRIEADVLSFVSFPRNELRMVYYYGPDECIQCCVYHAYELSCMFTQNEYVTIPLFAPNQDDVADVISNIRQYRYEFPVYVIFDDQKEFMRSIPSDVKYHNFLLGRDNVPLFVGDPVHSAEDAEKFEMVVQSYRE